MKNVSTLLFVVVKTACKVTKCDINFAFVSNELNFFFLHERSHCAMMQKIKTKIKTNEILPILIDDDEWSFVSNRTITGTN